LALIKQSPNVSDISDMPEKFRYIQLFLQAVVDVVNGRLTLAENHLMPSVNVTFSEADTNKTVSHGLGRAPRGFIVVGLTASMIIYDGSISATAQNITLKSSAAGTAKLLFV